MLYACNDQLEAGYNRRNGRGIYLRTADKPWGPWSEPHRIFSPGEEGYCKFMYATFMPCEGKGPNPHDRSQLNDNNEISNGGEYAPFLIPSYTKFDGDTLSLYWVMSTWNPYQVVLMRTHVRHQHRFFENAESLVSRFLN